MWFTIITTKTKLLFIKIIVIKLIWSLVTGLIKKSCQTSVDVFSKYLKEQIMDIIDSDKKVKHAKLAEGIEAAITDKKYVPNLDTSQLDLCYPAIIQSGGNYKLKFSHVSDKESVHFGAIVVTFGARYRSYCSNIARTFLVSFSTCSTTFQS